MADLRKTRAVAVTLAVIVLIYSVLFGATYQFNQYWSDRTTLKMVEWVADNSTAPGTGRDISVPERWRNTSVPVIGVTVDARGEILSQEVLGNGDEAPDIGETVVRATLYKGEKGWKAGNYIYAIRGLDRGRQLIVLTDSRQYSKKRQFATCAALSAGESILLAPVSLYLSRVIYMPSRRSQRREEELVSDVSHEMKTSLGAISINAQALAMDVGDNANVKNILSETDSMNRLTERLLLLSRIREKEPEKKTFSLSDMVEEMLLTYESAACDKHIGYIYDVTPQIMYTGDEQELRQLVAILLENAVKYTEEYGEIEARLFREGQRVGFDVVNTGSINPDDLPYIFDRFYTKAEAGQDGSFGLGLAIARTVTEKHGGVISAENTAGGHTVFKVRL